MNSPATAFDAIVVGSGITGGWAAKELTEKGLRVLLVERGTPVNHPEYPNGTSNPWDLTHHNRLTQEDRAQYPIQCRHFSFTEGSKSFFIKDVENPYEEIQRYDWVRANVLGGRSLLWGRHCYRWSDLDFTSNQRAGVGIDWPLRYKDLAPYYDYVESFVGISGNKDGIEILPDGNFMPPMEMNCVEKDFSTRVSNVFPGRKVVMGRVANLTAPKEGRGLCQFRDQCSRGCPFGGYFSTNSSTLPAALATGKLTVATNSLVNRVVIDEKTSVAKGIEVIDTQTGELKFYESRVLFLNAATLATTFILLNSTSARFPEGLGNDSGQVGRNLMDHHKCQGISAEVEGFDDSYYYGRRPNSLMVTRYRNVAEKHPEYVGGYNFLAGANRGAGDSTSIGAELKSAYAKPGPWRMWFTGFGECLPYEANRVTLNTDLKDIYGRDTISIDAAFRENEQAMHRDMAASLKEMLEATGYTKIHYNPSMSFPGNANHEMGTARMGKDPRHSVLNSFNQMHAVPNVFITDGSCMASSSCVNPSLTYMALTVRAVEYAVDQMKKQLI